MSHDKQQRFPLAAVALYALIRGTCCLSLTSLAQGLNPSSEGKFVEITSSSSRACARGMASR